jgi:hypothetical protein
MRYGIGARVIGIVGRVFIALWWLWCLVVIGVTIWAIAAGLVSSLELRVGGDFDQGFEPAGWP